MRSNLPKKLAGVLGVVVWIAATSAVACAHVEESVGAEGQLPAVVIGKNWMAEVHIGISLAGSATFGLAVMLKSRYLVIAVQVCVIDIKVSLIRVIVRGKCHNSIAPVLQEPDAL